MVINMHTNFYGVYLGYWFKMEVCHTSGFFGLECVERGGNLGFSSIPELSPQVLLSGLKRKNGI
jgi:hypothetical protein